jgi:hypothetical protein
MHEKRPYSLLSGNTGDRVGETGDPEQGSPRRRRFDVFASSRQHHKELAQQKGRDQQETDREENTMTLSAGEGTSRIDRPTLSPQPSIDHQQKLQLQSIADSLDKMRGFYLGVRQKKLEP